MTFFANDTDVRTSEWKICLYVVIKCPDFPGNGVVTGVAALMEIAVVRVVLTVAGNAVTFLVAKRLRRVAILALILVVHAKERESSKVVIEKHRVLPLHLGVATSTTRAQRTFMSIVVQMA